MNYLRIFEQNNCLTRCRVLVIGLFLAFSLSSCSVSFLSAKSDNEDLIPLTKNNFHKLNGKYIPARGLWEKLTYSSGKDIYFEHAKTLPEGTEARWLDYYIKFKAVKSKKIKAELWFRQQRLAKKTLRGSLENGFFVLKGRSKGGGIPLIYVDIVNTRVRLALNKQGYLSVDKVIMNVRNVALFSGESRKYYSYLYRRKK